VTLIMKRDQKLDQLPKKPADVGEFLVLLKSAWMSNSRQDRPFAPLPNCDSSKASRVILCGVFPSTSCAPFKFRVSGSELKWWS
jgi:hypothetical protein